MTNKEKIIIMKAIFNGFPPFEEFKEKAYKKIKSKKAYIAFCRDSLKAVKISIGAKKKQKITGNPSKEMTFIPRNHHLTNYYRISIDMDGRIQYRINYSGTWYTV